MRHLIDSTDLTVEEVNSILDLADRIIATPQRYSKSCEGKIIATLFYEPSTRTRLSFEGAMLHLGGETMGFASASSSSASKGESVADTIRVIGNYADICAIRHPKEGAPGVAAVHSRIPVINAGDGGHQHPTQTLTDLLTIRTLKRKLDHFTIGLCGDLKYGRTVHSLVSVLSQYEGVSFVFISPKELEIPPHLVDEALDKKGLSHRQVRTLEEAMGELDVLYMTRIQQERFESQEEYLRLKDSYCLDGEKMALGKRDMIVLHPLPRVNEIAVEVDNDPRAAYFKQVKYGMYVRMALILTLLGIENPLPEREKIPREVVATALTCENSACITTIEQGLTQRFIYTDKDAGACKCFYCEHERTLKK